MDDIIRHYFSDGVYAKQMRLPKHCTAITHRHEYDHLSILAQGEVIVTCDCIPTRHTAPVCINILANTEHSIFALEDSIFFCVHATDETDINKIDKVLIKGSENAMG